MQEIPGARRNRVLSPVAPLDERFAFQHVSDRFLQSVMVNSGLCPRLDQKCPAP